MAMADDGVEFDLFQRLGWRVGNSIDMTLPMGTWKSFFQLGGIVSAATAGR